MRNCFAPDDFLATNPDPHALFSLPGFTIRTIWPDLMHCKYMGVDQYFAGSVLVVCSFMLDIVGCTTWQERLKRVWALCLQYYKDHPVDAPSRYTRITGNMFTTPAYGRNRFPKLTGKAGQVKHLLPALLYAFDELRDLLLQYFWECLGNYRGV